MKCIFPENWAVLLFANLGKKEKSFCMLWRSCLLITRMNGSKGTLFGFVFLRFSYIIIIYFAASPHFIIPKYNRERKKKNPLKYLQVPEYSHGSSSWRFLLSVSALFISGNSIQNWSLCLFFSFFNGTFRTNSCDSNKTKAGFHNCLTRLFQAPLGNA